jgi:hypothetical protein
MTQPELPGHRMWTQREAAYFLGVSAHRRCSTSIGDGWLFPSDEDPSQPRPRITFAKWWGQAGAQGRRPRIARTWSNGHQTDTSAVPTPKGEPPPSSRTLSGGNGWGGIRTLDTLLTYTRFPGVRLKPLGHPSREARHAFRGRHRVAERHTTSRARLSSSDGQGEIRTLDTA